jgi:peptidoglycan/LPS O-acetylase OafA/YrhL
MSDTTAVPTVRSAGGHRWPAFDGVRALAVLAVMTFHADYPTFLKGGYVGVDVFFVLSGFLITWLLTAEHDKFDGISYRKFYSRRAFRLFPALVALIIGAVVLVLADGGLANERHLTLVGLPFVILYIGNWKVAFGSVVTLGLLSITWSLAIEEQYYILWPLGLTALLRRMSRQRIALLLAAAAIAEQVVRAILGFSNSVYLNGWIDKSTLTHTDGLLLGSALALWWSERLGSRIWHWIEQNATLVSLGGLAVLALVELAGVSKLHTTDLWVTVAVYGTLLLLAGLVTGPAGPVSRVLAWRPLQWIGKRSYGMYLYHFGIILAVVTIHLPNHHVHFVRFVVEFAITFVVAALSYRFIEQPFLVRKERLARIPAGTP